MFPSCPETKGIMPYSVIFCTGIMGKKENFLLPCTDIIWNNGIWFVRCTEMMENYYIYVVFCFDMIGNNENLVCCLHSYNGY